MNVTTAITTDRAFPDRWTASIVLDGDLTSWDCSHLHHSPAAAEKCRDKIARKVEAFLDGATVTRIGDSGSGDPLYEAEKPEARPASRLLPASVVRVSYRYSWPYPGAVIA